MGHGIHIGSLAPGLMVFGKGLIVPVILGFFPGFLHLESMLHEPGIGLQPNSRDGSDLAAPRV